MGPALRAWPGRHEPGLPCVPEDASALLVEFLALPLLHPFFLCDVDTQLHVQQPPGNHKQTGPKNQSPVVLMSLS